MPDYPVTTLTAVEREFTRLTAPPTSLTLDGAQLGHGLPPHPSPLNDLRMILLKRQTGWPLKDAVWAELASRAQNQGEPWTTAAIGMMLPALKKSPATPPGTSGARSLTSTRRSPSHHPQAIFLG